MELEKVLDEIEDLINENMIEDAYKTYVNYLKFIESGEVGNDIKKEFYACFSKFLFFLQRYDECLNMIMNAQNYGYSSNDIKEFIFEGFINCNLNEFKENYNSNIKQFKNKFNSKELVEFEELRYLVIPTMEENIYYLFDKISNKIIQRVKYGSSIGVKHKVKDDFSDFLIIEDYEWWKINGVIDVIKEKDRCIYIVIDDMEKFISQFQFSVIKEDIYENSFIFNGIDEFNSCFKNSNRYLPRNIIDLTNNINEIEKLVEDIHKFRLTQKGRKGDNILLSICIPTYNRGNRAYDNVINTLESYFDEEIEVVISDNASENDTRSYYDQISKIDDSRVKYFRMNKNEGFATNVCKVCDIANGKFVMLISDEDFVDINNIYKILNIIRSRGDEISIIRGSGVKTKSPLAKLVMAGEEAILAYMLTSNYMSGIMFNKHGLDNYKCIDYIINNLDNVTCLYYPHMIWELILCQYGAVQGIHDIVILEGKPEKTCISVSDIKEDYEIVPYATIESRIEQHIGFLNVIKELEICQKNFSVFREMYFKLCSKTMYLANLAINIYYKKTGEDLHGIITLAYKTCLHNLDVVYLNNKEKTNSYRSDVNRINSIYKNYNKF